MVSYAVANAKAFEPPFLFYNNQYLERIQKEKEDSIRLAKLKLAEKSALAKEMNKQDDTKKKRKKFLGIFWAAKLYWEIYSLNHYFRSSTSKFYDHKCKSTKKYSLSFDADHALPM